MRPVIEVGAGAVELTPVAECWARAWAAGTARVLRCPGQPSWCTAGELDERTAEVAGALQARGVGPGTRVVWQAGADVDSVVAALAVVRAGAALVPASAQQSPLERSVVVADTEPVLVIAPLERRGDAAAAHVAPWELGAGDFFTPALEADAPALIVYTSGTTGTPKGAVLTQANLAAGCSALEQAWALGPEDRLLSALPLFHVHGLVAGLFGILSAGGGIDLHARFEVDEFLAAASGATVSYCVPTMLHRLARQGPIEELAGLRLLVSGSAPLSVELFEAYEARAGQRILERYGMTETLLTLSNPLDGERRAGTVGRPLPGVRAALPEPGAPEIELRVAGPSVFAGYWGRPEATAEVLADGWMSTGDLVRVDEAGYVVVCGRAKELIISGGFNVYPSEVEDVLAAQPEVREAAVVGRPSAEWGEEVWAFVVPEAAGIDPEDLRRRLSGLMSPYKVPRQIHLVDELPRNALGKLQRHLL
jgi:malonyl-CoA/methylmalonyl-CoA synthetase